MTQSTMRNSKIKSWPLAMFCLLGFANAGVASEASINIPDLTRVTFTGLWGVGGVTLMYLGIAMCLIGAAFGLVQYRLTKALPVHSTMGNVSNIIWETCKTYLFQ